MIERNITLPDLILWTGTRVALGAGIGMLISRNLSKDAMKAAVEQSRAPLVAALAGPAPTRMASR